MLRTLGTRRLRRVDATEHKSCIVGPSSVIDIVFIFEPTAISAESSSIHCGRPASAL